MKKSLTFWEHNGKLPKLFVYLLTFEWPYVIPTKWGGIYESEFDTYENVPHIFLLFLNKLYTAS